MEGFQIYCENCFCIYWHQDHCRLQNIHISSLGYCQDCILIDFCEEVLQKEREKILKAYERTYSTWNK